MKKSMLHGTTALGGLWERIVAFGFGLLLLLCVSMLLWWLVEIGA